MTEKIIDIPREGTFEVPEGWRVLQYYWAPLFLGTGRPTSVRITNDPISLIVPPEMCGATYKGSICGFFRHEGRHSFEPEDSEDQDYQEERLKPIWADGPPRASEVFDERFGRTPPPQMPFTVISSAQSTIPEDEYHPAYYETESGLTPWDVVEAFHLDYWRATAVTHLLRAGRKPGDHGGNGAIDDIRKAYSFLGERLRRLKAMEQDEPIHYGPTDVG